MRRTPWRLCETDDTVFEHRSPAPEWAADRGEDRGGRLLGERFARHPDARFEAGETIVSGDRAGVRGVYLRGVDVFTVCEGTVAARLAHAKG